MSDIEKKYSDLQESECKTTGEQAPPIDERICPTCEEDPNFKLESPWFEISEAYLNKKVCEYHVRVYESEVKDELANRPPDDSFDDVMLEIAALKILRDFDKPINGGTKIQVKNAAAKIDQYYGSGSRLLGTAYLISTPAFNFDQILSNDDDNAEDNDEASNVTGGEFILNVKGLNRKLMILDFTLKTYAQYYASAQHVDDSFVIRQKDNLVYRLNYYNVATKIKTFRSELNSALSSKGYARVDELGIFKTKRPQRLKFVLDESGEPLQLKNVYALPDNGCTERYENIHISSIAKTPDMAVVCHLLKNLDKIHSDITAKETKPWLEWTLEHMYPEYIADRGALEDMDASLGGLECLLENAFGGPTGAIDSLAREIISAFTMAEKEYDKQSCRELERLQDNAANDGEDPGEVTAAEEERNRKMLARYEQEFTNKFYEFAVKQVKQIDPFADDEEAERKLRQNVNKSNLFSFMKKNGPFFIDFPYPEIKFKGGSYPGEEGSSTVFIKTKQELSSQAKNYATIKYNALEDSGGTFDQIQNSPHYHEFLEAKRELFNDENTFLGLAKNENQDFELLDIVSIIGLCGMSKLGKKALDCLAAGMSFDSFLNIMISKAFEFMNVRVLQLLIDDLPLDVRTKLTDAIQREFGPNVDLTSLFGVLTVGDNQKLKDFVTGNAKAKKIISLYKKDPGIYYGGTPEERKFLKDNLGDRQSNFIYPALEKAGWDKTKKIFKHNDDVLYRKKDEKPVFLKPEQYVIKETKYRIRKFKKTDPNFQSAIERFGKSLYVSPDAGPEELNEFERAKESFDNTALGVKVDIVFDIVFDYLVDWIIDELAIDELWNTLNSYPAVAFALDAAEKFLLPSCPSTPLIYPPPGDFMKSLKVDVCDPTFSLTMPKINIPSIDWRYQIQSQFSEIFREAIIKLVSDLLMRLMRSFLNTLEGALCNFIEAVGGVAADMITGDAASSWNAFGNSFLDALDEAFCNDGDSPETARKKAEELADALFNLNEFLPDADPRGSGAKVSNIISSVSGTNEILGALVNEGDDQFYRRISNAVNVLAPEMRSLLGSPNQVAYFFNNLGSHLSPEDRDRIRNLLDADIPNLPISNSVCLSNDELDEWNDLRNRLLQDQGFTPEQAAQTVADLNRRAEEALEDLMDDLGGLDAGDIVDDALLNELGKDPCNPNNVINLNSQDELSKEIDNQAVAAFYDNVKMSLVRGFTGRNSILGEALKDFRGNGELLRVFSKLFLPNYANSQAERDNKFNDKGVLGQAFMTLLTENNQAKGVYPSTVAIIQREKAMDESNTTYDFSYNDPNITLEFSDVFEAPPLALYSDQTYKFEVSATNNKKNKRSFNYSLDLFETITDLDPVELMTIDVPVSVTERQKEYMEKIGFQYEVNDERDIRKTFFNKFAQRSIPLPLRDYSDLYEATFEEFGKYLMNLMLTNSSSADGIPNGYKFGYITENLTPDSFVYTPSDEEGKLGTFASERIKPLDPGLYGGNYNNPPYYVEPRQFTGWIELATKAFTPTTGCEPHKPALISFGDIKNRTKDLNQRLREDPRLGKDPDCVSGRPFHLLVDKKTKAHLDGIVRTTIRAYIAEYFFKGYGLFSNLEMRGENFDEGLFMYVAKSMKSEMYDLGTSFNSNRITIVREKYWYTFLEQCVEAYQRRIDLDGIVPPQKIYDALNEIQQGLDSYVPINKEIRKKMRKQMSSASVVQKPSEDYNPRNVVRQGPVTLGLQSVAFRLTTDPDEKEDFFNGGVFTDISANDIRFASMKKLKFFQKIYFIALYEKQATMIMSELIKEEFSRLIDIVVDGLTDKPHYKDLSKALFSLMPGSSSKVGLSSFSGDFGDIPEITSDNSTPPLAPTDKPQFIVEKYARIIDKESPDVPPLIRNRADEYVGAIPLSKLSDFISDNIDFLEENYISDYFGNLRFTYESSILELFKKGFTEDSSLMSLYILNGVDLTLTTQPLDGMMRKIQTARDKFLASEDFTDFEVVHDDSFILQNENLEPSGVYGSTGIKYGIRLSLVFPNNFLTAQDLSTLNSNPEFVTLSRREKAYIFNDGSFVLPLVSEEIDVLDSKFLEFDPISGTQRYDLACLIDKLSTAPDYTLFIEKIFNLKQFSTLLAIYCMETFLPSVGRKVAPDDDPDPEKYERRDGKENDPTEEWDGTINKSAKNSMRRQFKSIYLSRTIDGLSVDKDDTDGLAIAGLFAFGNPFDLFALPSVRIPWFQKRRLKKKIYDANGMECADPKKDLQ